MTDAEKEAITKLIHDLIQRAVPKAQTVPKYGGILYTLKPDEKEGQFCGVFVFKNHVHLAFANGTSLDDPSEILQGTGKFRRHISVSDPDLLDTHEKAILKLLKQSAKKSME